MVPSYYLYMSSGTACLHPMTFLLPDYCNAMTISIAKTFNTSTFNN